MGQQKRYKLTILCFSSVISVGASITNTLCLKKNIGTVPKFLRSFLRSSSFVPTKTLGSFFFPTKFLMHSSADMIPPGCLHDSLITFLASSSVRPILALPSYSNSRITHLVMTKRAVSLNNLKKLSRRLNPLDTALWKKLPSTMIL